MLRHQSRMTTVFIGLGGKRRTRIKYKVIEKIQEYYSKPSVIPMLNAVNGSARQQRTERREACVSLLEAMVYSMDLVTLRVGYPGEHGTGDFVYRTIEWLAEKASISISRAKRAFKDLKSCGILSVKRVCRENDDGSHSSLAASKCFSKAFMLLLGFDKWMSKERKKASARKHEAQVDAEDAAKRTPQARAHSIMMTQMLLNQLTGGNLHDIDDDEPIPDRVY